jgi:hypothetical protein
MKKTILILLVLVIASTAFARPVKRIKFPRGATKVTVKGYLNGYKDEQIYLIRVRKGQKMTLEANRYVSLFITGPNGEDASDMDLSCHSHQVVENTKAGDYKIRAVECEKADPWKGSFKLIVRVVDAVADNKWSTPKPVNPDSPLQKAIDVTNFNEKIEAKKKIFETNPQDTVAKTDLADAYFARALALTEAAQYRSGIGDFRKGLKLNPDQKEAKEMYDQIISIYLALGIEPPKEGEESSPLPFKKP